MGDDVPEDLWEFLCFFREKKCFFVHLVDKSIDHLSKISIEQIKKQSVTSLANKIVADNPLYIVCMNAEIQKYVLSALDQSGIEVKGVYTIAAADSNDSVFIKELSEVLEKVNYS